MVKKRLLARNFPVPSSDIGTDGLKLSVPPVFAVNGSEQLRRCEWLELITSAPQELGTGNITFPRGSALDPKYYVPFWTYVEHTLKAKVSYIEAKLQPPWPYLLYNKDRLWIGLGFLAAGEDVNDFAHLCCWFLEQGKTVRLMSPQEVRLLTTRIDENYHFNMLGIGDDGDAGDADANDDDGAHPASNAEDINHPDAVWSNPLPNSATTTKVPHAFGRGKTWKSRSFEYWRGSLSDPSSAIRETLTIARGSKLARRYHSLFWQARDNFAKAKQVYAAAELAPPWPYVLCDDTTMLGYGLFDADQELDELAWMACMFVKQGLQVAFRSAEDLKAIREQKEPQS